MSSLEKAPDGTVLFLPGRLDRDPTVFRGMTSDELFLVGGAGAAMGLPIGLFLMALTGETTALLASFYSLDRYCDCVRRWNDSPI